MDCKFSNSCALLLRTTFVLLFFAFPLCVRGAIIDATWIGPAGGSYDDPANWDPAQRPVNTATDEFNVTIGNSQSVVYDISDDNAILDLTLGSGTSLTVQPEKSLNVLGSSQLSGSIFAVNGAFDATVGPTQFLGNGFSFGVSQGGTISLSALSYVNTLADYRSDFTLLSSDGTGSLLDLSGVNTLTSSSYGYRNASVGWNYDVSATNNGVIDLSSVTTINGANPNVNSDNRWDRSFLRLVLDSGGDIRLNNLTQTSGRTHFDVRVPTYSLPALETTDYTYFSAAEGTTIDVPALLSMENRGTRLALGLGSTFNAPELTRIQAFDEDQTGWSGVISLGDGAVLNTPKLDQLHNASLTWRPNRTFNHALTSIDGSEIYVVEGATFDLSGVANFTNNLSDYRADATLLSSDGTGSLLDLSGVNTLTSSSYGYRNASVGWNYDVSATNNGVIDLSSVTTINGANPNVNSDNRWDRSFLRLVLDSGGDIRLNNLTQTSGRTHFDVRVPTYSLPALETTDYTYFSAAEGTTIDVPALLSMENRGTRLALGLGSTFNAPELTRIQAFDEDQTGWSGVISLGDGAVLNTPKLDQLHNASLTWRPNRTFNHALTSIDGSEIYVVEGATFDLSGVANFTNNLSDYRADATLLSSDGTGSLLDLSGVNTLTSSSYGYRNASVGWNYDVSATNNGVIDLSSVTTINGANPNVNSDNRWDRSFLRLVLDSGGDIRLNNLTQTSGRTHFDVRVPTYSLPALETTDYTYFSAAEGTTIDVPALLSMENRGTRLALGLGSTFNAPELTRIQAFDEDQTGWSGVISLGDGAVLNTPKLDQLHNASLTWRPNRTFNHALTSIDGSEIYVVEGATFDLSGVANFTNNLSDYRADATLLSSDGTGSLLDLSGVNTLTSSSYGYRNASVGWNYDVSATNNGVIDLSSVTTINGANPNVNSDNRWDRSFLRLVLDSGGDIRLNNLTQTSGRTHFDVRVPTYSLPALETTDYTYFSAAEGTTIDVPALLSMENRGTRLALGLGSTFNAPELTRIQAFDEDQTGWSGVISLGDGAVLNTPKLDQLHNASLTWRPNRTFNHALTSIDGSEIYVVEGATFDLSGVANFTNNLSDYRADATLLSSDGTGSLLDLSGVNTLTSSSYGYRNASVGWNYDVSATNSGVIDLSSVTTINGARDNVSSDARWNRSWLRFRMENGGTIDLSNLRSTRDRVWFDVGAQGILKLGDLSITADARFEMRHISSEVHVEGSLFLSSSEFLMAPGATVNVAGDFLYDYTDETALQFDRGVLHLDGEGMQYLEAGGFDQGLGGDTTGNFAIGRLEIGKPDEPTTVLLLDLFDNGNRGSAGEFEALYLGGLGGPDGLVIHENSVLVLNGINAYAWLNGELKHLNSMFADGEVFGIPMGGGVLAATAPKPGDFNVDGRVDHQDLDIWSSNVGMTTGASLFDGDANGDNRVTGSDYLVWQRNFDPTTTELSTVPEPATAIMLTIVLASLLPQRSYGTR